MTINRLVNGRANKLVLPFNVYGEDTWKIAAEQLKMLTKAEYVCAISVTDVGICISYSGKYVTDDELMLCWLYEDEYNTLVEYNNQLAKKYNELIDNPDETTEDDIDALLVDKPDKGDNNHEA